MQACVLTYISDLNSGFGGLDLPIDPPVGSPSSDHAVWLHRPPYVEDWYLLDLEPVIASGGRGFYHGAAYDRTGSRCASICQELLTRYGSGCRHRPEFTARRKIGDGAQISEP